MKFFRILSQTLFYVFLVFSVFTFAMILYLNETISEQYKIKKGDTLSINTFVPVTAVYDGARLSQASNSKRVGDTFSVDLKVFGLIPFSSVNVEVVDEMYVAVLGNPFGMKIYTEGVLVIDMTPVATESGNLNPAADAGIKKGDYIVSVDGAKVYTNEDLAAIVGNSAGRKMHFEILRNETTLHISFSALKSTEDGDYRIGLWIRDSSAGIGTLTFYSPVAGIVCGLGHGICDEDTGALLTLNSGELVSAEIVAVTKGGIGSPGELKGKFTNDTLANIELNSGSGVFGKLSGKIDLSNLTEIALKQEVKDGNAQILCTVDGGTPKLYKCTIKKRSANYLSSTQNLVVTVTDKALLEKTGGIVQGMSGSPIIQNGKLIGAVTHVLVDDPASGYGIFAENMLNIAEDLHSLSSNAVS